MEALRVYRGLLANRPLTKLLVGEFISGIGDWLYIVAIFIVIYRQSQDAGLVGAFGAVRLIPYVVLSIPAGAIADRFDRRMILLVSDLARGAIMLGIAFLVATNGAILLIAALAVLATCGSAFFYPALGSYLPNLVTDERQLGPANSAWASLGNVSFIIGPAIGGLLVAAGGVDFAFLLNAATFVFIAAILWTLPPSRATATAPAAAEAPAAATASAAADAEALGAAEAAQRPEDVAASSLDGNANAPEAATGPPRVPALPFGGLALMQIVAGFLAGGMQVLTVVLAITVLKAGEDANGYLNAAIGVGGLLGAIGSGVLVLRRGLGGPLIIGAAIAGAGMAVLGAVPVLVVALIAIAVSSAGFIVLDVVLTTIFQRLVPDELRGRGIGVLMAVSTLAAAAGAYTLPVLVVGVGAAPSLSLAGLAMVAATVVGLVLVGGAATRETSPFEATLARVTKLPIFLGVPAARLEATLGRLRAVPVTPGQVIVREGDPADRFYIIQSGKFVVSQTQPGGESRILRELGPDEVFGELGLLREAPRSATVTAETDGTLLELDGADFLELAGSPQVRGRLLGLYAGGAPTGSS
jgi:MFS family permease